MQVALTWGLAGSGKFVRRNLALLLCNLSRHPDTFRQIIDDGVVKVAVQMVKAQREVGNIIDAWQNKPKLVPPRLGQARNVLAGVMKYVGSACRCARGLARMSC